MSHHIRGTRSDLIAFLVLSIWPSHFGLPLLLAIVLLSKKIQRHPTFINMCVTWIITGFSSSILLYAGKETGPEPPKMLCLAQASLMRGVLPMATMASFFLVIQMFFVIRASIQRGEIAPVDPPLRIFGMITVPYLLFLFFALTAVFTGASHPDTVSRERRFFYCSVDSHMVNLTAVVCGVILLATLFFEAWIVLIIYRVHVALKSQGSHLPSSMECGLPLRIVLFGTYLALGMCLSVLYVGPPTSPVPDLILSTTPTAVVLIFGSQPDVIRVVCFWRRSKSAVVLLNLGGRASPPPERPLDTP